LETACIAVTAEAPQWLSSRGAGSRGRSPIIATDALFAAEVQQQIEFQANFEGKEATTRENSEHGATDAP
jgi:hypothetical protein